jgi:hypothetical protein
VHIAEYPLDDVFRCEGVRKYGPISARDIALLEGLIAKLKEISGPFLPWSAVSSRSLK